MLTLPLLDEIKHANVDPDVDLVEERSENLPAE